MTRVTVTDSRGQHEVHLSRKDEERMAADRANYDREIGTSMSVQKTHRKTKRGRMVPILPNFQAEQDAWDELYSQAVDCLDKITAAEQRDAQIARNNSETTARRFPVLGGQ